MLKPDKVDDAVMRVLRKLPRQSQELLAMGCDPFAKAMERICRTAEKATSEDPGNPDVPITFRAADVLLCVTLAAIGFGVMHEGPSDTVGQPLNTLAI